MEDRIPSPLGRMLLGLGLYYVNQTNGPILELEGLGVKMMQT